MKYLCAITLPDDISEIVEGIQRSYKTAGWKILIQPHITLLPPGTALASVNDAEKFLKKIAGMISPFDVEVEGVGRFHNHSNTVFAKTKASEEMQLLRESLIKTAPSFMSADQNLRSREFHPHITLSNKLSDITSDQIISQLEQERIHFFFVCQSFSLFKKDLSDPKWVEIKRLALA